MEVPTGIVADLLGRKISRVIGLHTDKRAAFTNVKLNPMIFSHLEHISESVDDLLLYLETVIGN